MVTLQERARDALRAGDHSQALADWTRVREKAPDCLDAYVEPGNILVSLGRFTEADQLLGDAVIRFPERPAAAVAYAMSAHHHRDWPEACQRWQNLCRDHPAYGEGFVRLAETLRVMRRFDAADQVLSKAL